MAGVFHRSSRHRRSNECAAIFVHAGAGYHSVQNETVHLRACEDAAAAAMALLRNGAKAVDAVEMAIKVLEDREITNAGYGSNLSIDGLVEGDAVVVDHSGRSGAVGAIAQIKNPISAARMVLDLSTTQLSLRRVPPNLLVGQGATDWAFGQGIPVLPHDALVSPSARDRWYRWRQDLRNEEKRRNRQRDDLGRTAVPTEPPPQYQESIRNRQHTEQTAAITTGTWNEGQPTSPMPATGPASYSSVSSPSRSPSVDSHHTQDTPATPSSGGNLSPSNEYSVPSIDKVMNKNVHTHQDATSDMRYLETTDEESDGADVDAGYEHDAHDANSQERHVTADACADYDDDNDYDSENDVDDQSSSASTLRLPSLSPSPKPESKANVATFRSSMADEGTQTDARAGEQANDPKNGSDTAPAQSDAQTHPSVFSHKLAAAAEDMKDLVFDTVGAIAIDNDGNIACGASSGGIGMKYRGRIGPAALVGVGAAVCPVDADDKTKISTACVTSGTGEHMATTGAAQVCADRVYNSVRKRRGGGFEPCEDDQAVKSMIENDFMGHPGIRNSHSMGAIGVLAVKKTLTGAYLYFAHNTDSFALASMSADEPKATCTMSRSHGNGMVAQGGRAIRYKKRW